MSSSHRTVPIESIIVSRGERQRRDLKDLAPLMRSIATNGVINAPLVTSDMLLVAGERRLTSCKELGHTHITVSIRDELSTASQRQIELAENVDRLELDWKDKSLAIAEFHAISVYEFGDAWSQEETAGALNMGRSVVTRNLALAKELELGTKLIVDAPAYSVALNIMERTIERRRTADADALRGMLGGPRAVAPTEDKEALDALDLGLPAAPTNREPSAISKLFDEEIVIPETPTPFRCGDFSKIVDIYQGTPYNFLHCDFPYGVNADKHHGGAADKFGGYEDSKDVYFHLLETLKRAMTNMVAESAHMMFWYSMDYHTITVKLLEEMGWKVNPFPMIWYRSDNSGILPDPKRGPRRNYETALLCTRGDRKIVQAVSNVAPNPNTKLIHMSEKPIPMLRHFFRMFVDESTNMLDPTMGSGNAVVLAESLGAKARGIEKNKEFYETARNTYAAGGYADGLAG